MSPTVATTDVGKQRDRNEDAVLTESIGATTLLTVADGMGGHAAGDVASQLAIETLSDALDESAEVLAGPDGLKSALASAVHEANTAVYEAADQRQQSSMGTTLVTGLVRDREAVIANVGDSRAYEIHTGSIEQVTVDQSFVRELVEQGEITEEEVATHPQRNVISQALGTQETVDPDFYSISLDGTLLLCSDGLTEEVADGTICRVVSQADGLSEAADSLVTRANANGGSDNITVLLYR
jgi:serine/threonine protein phosphatase PrpC